MKSILIITSFLPYPIHSGGEQAQYNMIEALRKTCKIGIIFPLNRDYIIPQSTPLANDDCSPCVEHDGIGQDSRLPLIFLKSVKRTKSHG